MKVSVHPAAADELRETASFYSRQADQALGLAFIAEFERALNLLPNNPELGAVWRGTARRFPLRRFPYQPCVSNQAARTHGYRFGAPAQATELLEEPKLSLLLLDSDRQCGEFVVLVSGAPPREVLSVETLNTLSLLLEELPLKQAVQLAAKISGANRNELYQHALQMKKPDHEDGDSQPNEA